MQGRRWPGPTEAERWEYIIMAGSNQLPVQAEKTTLQDKAVQVIGAPQTLAFLLAVMTVVALAPQAPGAHGWAAERSAQSASAPVAP